MIQPFTAAWEVRERRKCRRKKVFLTEYAATLAARAVLVASGHNHRPYACPWCGNFHLTSRKEN